MIRSLLAWTVRLAGVFVLGTVFAATVYRFVAPPLTPLMGLRSLERLARGERPWLARSWIDLEAVSPALLQSVVAAEDARFFRHYGVDVDAVAKARRYNTRHRGQRLHGASTITMQCARNVFLWPGRTYVRKTLEVYFTALLELLWDKRRILEVYVNVAEWGDGVFGVEAAARRYFGVAAARLTRRQAALLAAALPNPRRSNPAAPTPYLVRRAAVIEARAARIQLEWRSGSGGGVRHGRAQGAVARERA